MWNALPILLYAVLFVAAVFAPLRWSVVAFLLLSNIDLGSLNASVGLMNTAKAMILPLILLWRFRAYAGHQKISAAPVAWVLLTVYVAIASTWSALPAYAIKLIGHLIGSLLICLMLMRATKGGHLSARSILPVTVGTLAIAVAHWIFLHDWGGETERFTTFAGAQSFAAFAAALYCAALALKPIRPAFKIPLCTALIISVLLNGSRTWITGLLCSTFLAVFVCQSRAWLKVVTLGMSVVVAALAIGGFDTLMKLAADNAKANRIAAAASAAYEGNIRSTGLGTYNLRYELFRRSWEAIEKGTPMEMIFGHGTCNGVFIAATLSRNPDPNRAMHDEWLRVAYEWGVIGFALWMFFILSLVAYATRGVRTDRRGYAQPLLIYLPAFAIGLSGENIIAGAGNAVSVGLLLLIALAGIAYRPVRRAAFSESRSHHPLDPRRPGPGVFAPSPGLPGFGGTH